MDARTDPSRRRGRPPKQDESLAAARDMLLHTGLDVLTETGFPATGLDGSLARAGVPKGSFHRYFDGKEAFGLARIDCCAGFFARQRDRHSNQPDRRRCSASAISSTMPRTAWHATSTATTIGPCRTAAAQASTRNTPAGDASSPLSSGPAARASRSPQPPNHPVEEPP
ncbi:MULTISPECIES: TetR/AcrR family transcriptional regulator [Burkholderia]|uniref:TetR/AcrR family transcriptional regulator n=1 Tax=Burkholderia TaxID=32008 RepID=UPI001F34ECAD|nr:TetR/AcrR family transcriptional regulator [Burkholderia paludis]